MAQLTKATRDAIPTTDFAIPSQRAYPIKDEGHARIALTDVAVNGTPAEQAQVRAAVAKRYPNIGAGSSGPATGGKGKKKKRMGRGRPKSSPAAVITTAKAKMAAPAAGGKPTFGSPAWRAMYGKKA